MEVGKRVNKVCSNRNCIRPERIWKLGMRKKGNSSFHNMSMFSFDKAILLRCIWAGNLMNNTI